MSDLMQEYINKAQKELARKEWNGIDFILRNLIDNPISGDITLTKLKDRHIISFVYHRFGQPPHFIENEKDFKIEIYSDFWGVRQGGYIIQPSGDRIGIDTFVLENARQEFIDYSCIETEDYGKVQTDNGA